MIVIAIVVLVVAITVAFVSSAQNNTADTKNTNLESITNNLRLSAFATGSPVRGSSDALVTMVEFGDYQCTNCNRFFHNTEPTILQNYVETGKIKMIFMDFAFIGPDSVSAAQAAHCAQDQGRYWDYHDEVYSNWNGENTGWASTHNLKKFAANIDLEFKSFNECLDSGKYASKVSNNMNVGRQLGVTATPTFFIFGSDSDVRKIVGAQPYSSFSGVLDSLIESGHN